MGQGLEGPNTYLNPGIAQPDLPMVQPGNLETLMAAQAPPETDLMDTGQAVQQEETSPLIDALSGLTPEQQEALKNNPWLQYMSGSGGGWGGGW